MHTVTALTTLLLVLAACGSPAKTSGNIDPVGAIQITFNVTGLEPLMDAVLAFSPYPAAEPKINILAQNLAAARKQCSNLHKLSGEELVSLHLTLSDGTVVKNQKTPISTNSWTSCLTQALEGKALLMGERGIHRIDIEILLSNTRKPEGPH